jgi:small subunit ribosomal protein S8
MSMTDPIAHMLTKMRNAIVAKKPVVEISPSQLKTRIAAIFKEEGYIADFKVTSDKEAPGVIQIQFKYDKHAQNVITNLQRVSKPSRRVYVGTDEIPTVLNGMGMAILSTSKGVMTDRAARQAGVGGEVLCYVW